MNPLTGFIAARLFPWKERKLSQQELASLSKVSDFARSVIAYSDQPLRDAIKTSARELDPIPIQKQAQFFAALFTDQDHLEVEKIPRLILRKPRLLFHADYWSIGLTEGHLQEMRSYLLSLQPNKESDWKKFRAIESFCDALAMRDKIADLGEEFWGKALDHALAKPRLIETFCKLIFEFPHATPPLIKVGVNRDYAPKMAAHPSLQKIIGRAATIPHLKEFDWETRTAFLHRAEYLKELDLSCCEDINSWVSLPPLRHLEKLNLSKTTIFDELLPLFLRETIKELNLSDCQNIHILKTPYLENLEELDLSDCKNILSLENLPDLHHLKKLNLSYTPISDAAVIAFVKRTTLLEELNLNCCENIGSLKDLPDLPRLKKLSLETNKMRSADLIYLLYKTPHLEELNLQCCPNIFHSLEALPPLPHMETLLLSSSALTSEGLKSIAKSASNIKKLFLGSCTNLSTLEECLEFPQLEHLTMNNSLVSEAEIVAFLKKVSKIKVLNLSNCRAISSLEGLPYLLNLERANFSFTALTDLGLSSLLASRNHIRELELVHCKQISCEQIPELPQLESINLSRSSLTSAGINNLLRSVKNLKIAHLSITAISNADALALVRSAKHLRKLSLDHCRYITDLTRFPRGQGLEVTYGWNARITTKVF